MRTAIGVQSDISIVLRLGNPGHGLFGPYVTLPPGSFEARVYFAPGTASGGATVEIVTDRGRFVLISARVAGSRLHKGVARIEFSCQEVTEDVEVRLTCDGDFEGEITRVEIERREQDVRKKAASDTFAKWFVRRFH